MRYELAVEVEHLLPQLPARGPVPPSLRDQQAVLQRERPALARLLERSVRVSVAGRPCSASLDDVAVEPFRGTPYALLSSTYACATGGGPVTVDYGLLLDPRSAAAGLSHASVTDWSLAGRTGRTVFEADERRLEVGGTAGTDRRGDGFLSLGLHHALSGLDHVLFVVALLLGAGSVRAVLRTVAAFTAAHSASLALAATGLLVVPPAVVEPLIALSIVGVAVQNVVQPAPRHRLPVVLAFGLVHGLGFAGGASFGDAPGAALLWSVLAFNVGVELAQLAVMAATAPLLLVARRRGRSRPVVRLLSGGIALAGAAWLVSRVPLG